MENQLLVACLAVIAFAIAALWYCWYEAKKSRRLLSGGRPIAPDTVETRSRRSF